MKNKLIEYLNNSNISTSSLENESLAQVFDL